MREFVRDFCRISEEILNLEAPVVELGSYQVEGQEGLADLRPIFGAKQYIGCDMRSGTGVDRVENLPKLSFGGGSVHTIVYLDTLEHVFEVDRRDLSRAFGPGCFCSIIHLQFSDP
jgi:hypothetical protein